MADKWSVEPGCLAGSFAGQSSQDCDVLTTEDCSGSDDEEESKDPEMGEMPPEFNTYWSAAIQNSSNITSWSKLIAYSERTKNLAACRKAYETFFMHFPLAHIYWKKYADIEQNLGSAEEAEKIFIRAVKSNPLNVTLWTSYILFLLKIMNIKLPESAEKLRGVFSEAINACGMEFRSDELWSLYIEYEAIHGNLTEAMALYNRVLNIPTQRYAMHFERFKILVSTHSPLKFLTTEELSRIHTSIQAENDNEQIASEDLPTGDLADSLTEMDLQKIRQHILDTRKQMHLLNEVQVNKRSVFEMGIKRLYFSASPLSVKQLKNWRIYLNFEMSEGQHERIVVLFERCLMPCAQYDEVWMLYARYMERHSIEDARSVFERACRTYLPLKFKLHLQWALFEEKHGQLDSARAILCNIANVLPEVAMVRLRHVNFERRNGNLQEAERLLREAIQKSSSPETTAFYTGKLARLLLKIKNDPEKARDVLIEGLKMVPNSPYLHQCLLEMEVSRDAEDGVMHCVERALNSNINETVKGILSQRRLEFLEDFGNNIKSLRNAFDGHQTLIKQEELKRKANYKYTEGKKAKTQSCNPPVENIVIPEAPKPEIPSPGPPLASRQSVTVLPAQTTTANERIETKPPQIQAKPPQIQVKPPQTQAKPPQIQAKPVQIETKPAQIKTKPVQIETKPAQIKTKHVQIETKPAQIKTKPVQIENKPVQIEAKPVHYQQSPRFQQPRPVQIEADPVHYQQSPRFQQTRPVQIEASPVHYQQSPRFQQPRHVQIEADQVHYQQSPRFQQPRPHVQPYFPHQRTPGQHFMPIHFNEPVPPRMPPPSQMPQSPMPPNYMRGPPVPFPPYNYKPWPPQNFEEYNRPRPWNFNAFYPPY